jgi:DNA-binding CsgD family transcriptional regulator
MDPEVIARLLDHNSGNAALGTLSPRERDVLALMAEGRSNAAIAQRLVITERAVSKHTASIFTRLGLQPSGDDNPRTRRPRLPRRRSRTAARAHPAAPARPVSNGTPSGRSSSRADTADNGAPAHDLQPEIRLAGKRASTLASRSVTGPR